MPDSSLIPQLSRALMLWALRPGGDPRGASKCTTFHSLFIRQIRVQICGVRLLRRDSESECFMKSYMLHLIPRDLLSNSAD